MHRIPIYSLFGDSGKIKAEQAIETAVENVLTAAGWDKVAKDNVYWPDGDFNVMQARAYDRAAREEVIGRVTMGSVSQEYHRRGYYRQSQKPVAPVPPVQVTPTPTDEELPEMPPIVSTAERPAKKSWLALAILGLLLLTGGKA